MRFQRFAAISAAFVIFTSSSAFAQTAPAKTADTSKGKTLVDNKGMALFVFEKDAGGKSMCNGRCAENWPALTASPDAKASGGWTVLTRDDGKMMWAYKGTPLYTWNKDKVPGDTTGDGVSARGR
jgi:predicted lipoprotein with Yx(FWY)xxD motif